MAEKTSSILDTIANPVVANPLAAMDAGTRVAGTIYNLRTQQANEAIGGLLQQATDANGNIDYAKANALASRAGPVVQMGMQEMLKNNSALRGQQLAQSGVQNQALNGAISSVLNLPDDQLHDAVVQQTQRLVAAGVLPQDRAYAGLLSLSSDPKTLRTQLETLRIQGLPPGEQGTALYGTQGPDVTTPGGGLQGTRRTVAGPNTGTITPSGPSVAQGIPGLDEPYTYEGPHGEKLTTTKRQFLIDHGFTWAAQGGPGGAPGGLPSSLRNPANAQPGAAQPQPGASTTPTPQPGPAPAVTAPPPADIEQQKGEALRSTDAFRNISTQAVASRSRSAVLGNMLGDAAQFTSGPLAGTVEKLRNYANNLGIKVNTEGLSAAESFNKLASQLADAQGVGSDARMNVNIAANPHSGMSAPGVDLIVRQLQGNEDYLQARAALAAKYPNQGKINDFENEQGSKLDPRAFQFARMTAAQRQTFVKNLSAKDKAAVQQSYNWAHNNGLIGG